MGNLFKFIENAIFEQEETQQEAEKKEPQARQQEQQQPATAVSAASAAQSEPYAGNIRRHFAELISEAVEQADIAGPDYRELKDAFDTEDMKQNIPDPTTRWKTCFSMMRMMHKGLTKQHILASIDVYTGVVDHEKRNALAQIEEKRNELVGKKSAAVTEAEKRIKDAEAEITRLQEKINKINERMSGDRTFIENAKAEIAAGETEINADKADLEVTAETIRKTLTDDKATLEAILPNDQ
jgi:peptidoglycan hydrolase CwlO-like protein